MSAPSPLPLPEAPWRAGLRAARMVLVPGLFLQAFALLVVLGYYWHPPTTAFLNELSLLRQRTGLAYVIIATGLCGGVLPFIYLRLFPGQLPPPLWRQGLCLTLFWSYKGLEVDFWYRILARFVGTSTDVGSIAFKTFLDQFVYCPLWAVPITVLVYMFNDNGWKITPLIADFRQGGWYRRHILPSLLANQGLWVPVVCLVYALPLSLQLPLFNLVLCFYTLMMAHLIRHQAKHR